MEYLLKVNAVIVIYYLCYKLFLERDTFFEWNRWFLLLGLVTSFMIPFIVIPNYIEYTAITLPDFSINEQVSLDKIEESYTILDYISFVYALGIVFFLIRFFIQLKSLSSLIYKNKGVKKDQFNLVQTRNNTSPFSFFKWIVYNPEKFSKTELEQIIAHEIVHAKQYHSIDVLMAQLFCIVFWLNPFVWFYNKDLKKNLEFIADKDTLKLYSCKKSYQYTLLKTSIPNQQMALSNHFYNSLIKKRIVMLHKTKSKKINLLKYTLVIPLLAVFIFNFNTKIIAQSKDKVENINITGKSDAGVIVKLKDSDNPLIIIDGKESPKSRLDNLNHSNIESINVFKGDTATKAYGNKGKNGVMLVTTKKQNKSPWKVSAERNNVIYATKDTIYVNEKPNVLKKLANDFEKQPLYILDGKEITKKELDLLDEQTINAVSITKGEHAIRQYGEKGKNGVIIIKSRISGSQNSPYVKTITASLYIVDGKEVKKEVFENINPENIKSMNVFKGESVIKKYGDKGENGVIEITTKVKSMNNIKVIGYDDSLDSTKTNINLDESKSPISSIGIEEGKEPIYIINDKISSRAEALKVKSNNFKSIIALRGKEAIEKYGDKAKDGAIEITLKK